MLDKAIAKINAEIEKEKNSYIQVCGQFLLGYLTKNPENANNILNPDKTIMKSLDEMKKAAQGRRGAGFWSQCAVLTEQEGFNIVLEYFGIQDEDYTIKTITTTVEIINKQQVTQITDEFKLEDFM